MIKDGEYTVRTYKEGDDDQIKSLLALHYNAAVIENWDWRVKKDPYFDPDGIIIAEKDGKMVGITSFSIVDLKMGDTATVKACVGNYVVVVHPEHRMRGIYTQIHRRAYEYSLSKGAVVYINNLGGLILDKIQRPVFGRAPIYKVDVDRWYKTIDAYKIIKSGISILNHTIEQEGLNEEIKNYRMHVLILTQEGVFNLFSDDRGFFTVERGKIINPDIVIEGDFVSFIEAKSSKLALFKLLLKRKLKVRGNIRKLIKLYYLIRE